MNNRASLYAQAVRGPVLLIVIGILFAMHQAGVLPFSRTWPLLIIVVGIMKLIERWNAPRPPFPPPPLPPPAGGPRP
ncbi:MAG: LiaI-LiaF-like domain-containing protein [Bryobacteraceae bacterium]